MLKGRTVIVGVCGGIAAYKAAELVRLFRRAAAEVHVIMTASATEFIAPLTFQTLTGNPVHVELFNLIQEREIGHISLADRADLFVVAPATANLVGKVANGIADDLLTTTIMATRAPVLLAPAMNVNMYENPIYRSNQQCLLDHGYQVMEPVVGELACGWEGAGKLPDPADIFDEAVRLLAPKDMRGLRVLVTAGPTREEIDPVRYISNHSSGKMGYAIARAAAWRGADVTLVSGPTCLPAPRGVRRIDVVSAEQMHREVLALADRADLVFKAAAVADYRPVSRAQAKLKKGRDCLERIDLEANPDILADLGKNKGRMVLVGFAAETDDLEKNAAAKLAAKGADLIVANDVSRGDIGFDADQNEVRLFFADGRNECLEKMDKAELADRLLDCAVDLFRAGGDAGTSQ